MSFVWHLMCGVLGVSVLAGCSAAPTMSAASELGSALAAPGLEAAVERVTAVSSPHALCQLTVRETAHAAPRYGRAVVTVLRSTRVQGGVADCTPFAAGQIIRVWSDRPVRETYPFGIDADAIEVVSE